jgi:hypothetical protein
MGTSRLFGTMTVSTTSPERRTNLTWLPFWLNSLKPADSSRRLISRKGCGLSRPNLNLNGANSWRPRGLGGFKVELQCLFQIGKSFFFTFTLAGNIDFQALRNIPVSFAPHSGRERPLHDHNSSISEEPPGNRRHGSDPVLPTPTTRCLWYNTGQMFAFPPRSRMKIPTTAVPCSKRAQCRNQASPAVPACN